MGNWLVDMEGMFTSGVKDITFQPSQWNAITFGSEIRTELFPKVYLEPHKLWVDERDKIIGTMITAKTFQALELKRMITIDENVGENIQYHQYANGLLIKEYSENGTVYYEIVSKVEYKEEAVQVEPPKENKLLDGFQFVLDVAGLIPVYGEIADGLNGVIYYARGDKLNAGLSFAAMIPVAGWGSTATKFANKGSQLYQARNVLSDEKVASMFTPTYQEVVNGPLSRTQANMYMFKTDFNNMTPKSVTFNSPLTGNLSLSKPDVPSKGTVKDRQIDYTRGFDVEPKYSSYEQRVKTTPVNKGEWSSERAESLFISDKTGEVKKYLDEAGVDGVEYKNGMPDFSPFSKGEIKLENMTNDRKSNFSTADEELAKNWSTPDKKWTAEDVADWREDNKYTWHELNDLETIQLVPRKINSVFGHLGGVGEYNIKVKLGE
ncbi:HNH endonuclease [Psychrobacillus sp. MER TA 171]|nr:HNH endonuclease [Psychrobacillus sp. MER TA 171]